MAKEDKEKVFSRRDFLKTTGVATGGILGGSLLGSVVGYNLEGDTETESPETDTESSSTEGSDFNYSKALTFFTRESDFNVLVYATERIFPEDDNGPGAISLEVPYFIDKQLGGRWGSNTDEYRAGPFQESTPDSSIKSPLTRGDIFIQGLRLMNELSQERFETTFNEAEEDQQIEILEDFDNNEIEMKGITSRGFFDLLRQITLEGVFSDPLHGGNKNMGGWDMIRYPGAIAMNYEDIDSEEFVVKDPVSISQYQGH